MRGRTVHAGLFIAMLELLAGCTDAGSPLEKATGSTENVVGWSSISANPPGKIVFSSNRSGDKEIYAILSDGSGLTNLTSQPGEDLNPSWSPDGTRIVFASARDGNEEIYVMNADGSGVVCISNHPAADFLPKWSPDGKKIAFGSDRAGSWQIYVMNPDGSEVTRLTDNYPPYLRPDWSPDGSKIVFQGLTGYEGTVRYDIYTMNADGTGITNLTNYFANDRDPAWSPDGSRILFSSDRDSFHNGPSEIYVMNADGGGVRRLTEDLEPDDRYPEWSPDGAAVVFAKGRGGTGNHDLYIALPDGSAMAQLTDGIGDNVSPGWRATMNRSPIANAGGPYSGTEGLPVQFIGGGSSDSDGDPLVYSWDFGDGTTAGGAAPAHAYADEGIHTVRLIVTDPAGAADTAESSVNVVNVPPTVNAGPDVAIRPAVAFTLQSSFADPGRDVWNCTIDWGDGTIASTSSCSPASTVTGSHTYSRPGTYTVAVRVDDDDGGTGLDTFVVTVQGNTSGSRPGRP